jgi:2,5-furandicarboxylate decarboxylase 1
LLRSPKGLREFLSQLASEGKVKTVEREVSADYEAASVLAAFDGQPTVLKRVCGSSSVVVGNIYSSRALVAQYFGVSDSSLLQLMAKAITSPIPTGEPQCGEAPCYGVVEDSVDLHTQIPALLHTRGDGGKYVTAAVFCASHPKHGVNLSCHRLMVLPKEKNKFAIRIVPRDLNTYLKDAKGELDAVATIGNGLGYLLAAATTVPTGYDELGVANALEPQKLVKASTVDLPVPADSEYVLEGRIYEQPATKEGPFFDLTLTLDAVRDQPVFEVKRVAHRKHPLYHALLPGYGEHRVLMGLPREPTIYNEVSKVADCLDVYLTPGGGSWLHCVVKIRKRSADDGIQAAKAAFRGHGSLKHVVVVDDDVDIRNPEEVEWAVSTRFQAEKGLLVLRDVTGSSLDPSANRMTRKTSKMGMDATIPFDRDKWEFKRWRFDPVNKDEY